MEKEDNNQKHIVVMRDYIETQINYYGAESDDENTEMVEPAPAGFNEIALRGYILAGLLTSQLLPAPTLNRGEKAMLAHALAERMGMAVFWPFFQQRWNMKCLAVAYSKYIGTKESKKFQQRLDFIE